MFDPNYENQERVGEEGGNPFEDKHAAAAAAAADAGNHAYCSTERGGTETKKQK